MLCSVHALARHARSRFDSKDIPNGIVSQDFLCLRCSQNLLLVYLTQDQLNLRRGTSVYIESYCIVNAVVLNNIFCLKITRNLNLNTVQTYAAGK